MSRNTAVNKEFKLGEQPEWAGKEPNANIGIEFIDKLLLESSDLSLINRGYALIKLDDATRKYYDDFHSCCELFFNSNLKDKEYYGQLQFEKAYNSPNQCHGYSCVANLKEQFMMRCIGNNLNYDYLSDLKTPSNGINNKDFGVIGMKLYQNMDLLCRKLSINSLDKLNIKNSKFIVNNILDPINKINNNKVVRNNNYCYSDYMPDGYISSSIIDNFHYYPPSNKKSERFHNNHSSHTDSGLMTVVVITDEPGLEVFDQKLNSWINIEELIQLYFKSNGLYKKDNKYHRNYCIIFWSDSVEYLNKHISNNNKLNPCFHRVANCNKERISLVFKQRTAPLRTHCRYQEDFILAKLQALVDQNSKNSYTLFKQRNKVLDIAVIASIVGSFFCYAYFKQGRKV